MSQSNDGGIMKTKRRLRKLLVSARVAARLVEVDVETWRRWDAAGKTPAAVRLTRGCTRWRLSELRAWVRDGCPGRRQEALA